MSWDMETLSTSFLPNTFCSFNAFYTIADLIPLVHCFLDHVLGTCLVSEEVDWVGKS